MTCKYCGNETADGVKFCTSCGAPIGSVVAGMEYQEVEQRSQQIENRAYRKLGGFLLFIVIVCFISGFGALGNGFLQQKSLSSSAELFRTFGYNSAANACDVLIANYFIVGIGIIISAILIIKKDKFAIKLFVFTRIANIVMAVIASQMLQSDLSGLAFFDKSMITSSYAEIGGAFISLVIFIIYFKKSKRVETYFSKSKFL